MQNKFTEVANKITNIKSDFAEAITAKGVETLPSASFGDMISNVGKITGGGTEPPVTEGWVKPHDWPDIEAEALEPKEIRMLMCDFFDGEQIIDLAKLSYNNNIVCTVDWGDGSPIEEIDSSVAVSLKHTFPKGQGVSCDRGYTTYVVKIKNINNVASMIFNKSGADSTAYKYNNILWFNGDLQSFRDASNMLGKYYNISALLEKVKLINTKSILKWPRAFCSCSNLLAIEGLDLSQATDIRYILSDCISLKEYYGFNAEIATSYDQAFNGCSALRKVSFTSTSHVKSFYALFGECISLFDITGLDFTSCTNIAYMYEKCVSLKEIPYIDTPGRCTIDGFADGASAVRKIGGFSKGHTFFTSHYSFRNMNSLIDAGTIMLEEKFTITLDSRCPLKIINFVYDEAKPPVFDATVPIKLNYTQLNADDLNKLMTQLPDGNGKPLDLKYNPGSATCDKSIATAKNWTVLI